jgi:RNA polymerase sigma factor (sigma-70 family)
VLVARHTAAAHRLAVLLGVGPDADDVVQEAFVKAYRHIGRFRAEMAFRPWVLRIVANEAKNMLRAKRRHANLALRLAMGDPHSRSPEDPERDTVAGERRTDLLAAVRGLPDREREAVICRYFLELSEAETAQVLGWPIGTVKSRTFRALGRLRTALGDRERVLDD